MAVIILVHHRGGDDAGRGGGHEALDEIAFLAREGLAEQAAFFADARVIFIADLGQCRRRVVHSRPWRPPSLDHFSPFGKQGNLGRLRPLALAAKAGHARADIGLETNPRLFAIVGDIDAAFPLARDNAGDGSLGLGRQGRFVYGFTVVLTDQQIG